MDTLYSGLKYYRNLSEREQILLYYAVHFMHSFASKSLLLQIQSTGNQIIMWLVIATLFQNFEKR